jgi:hypothetical protein
MKIESTDDAWDNGELGTSKEHTKSVAPEVETAIDASLGLHTTQSVDFEDPRVQIVYDILCEAVMTPEGEHWEGFAARKIVDALIVVFAQQAEDSALFTFSRDMLQS